MKKRRYKDGEDRAFRVVYLISGYIKNTLTDREHKELDAWVTADDKNMQLFEELTDEKTLGQNLEWMDKLTADEKFQALYASGRFRIKTRVMHPAWKLAAAVLLVAGLFVVFRYALSGPGNNGNEIAKREDIAPGGNRATLTLSDGSVLDLAKLPLGKVPGDSSLDKSSEDELVYDPSRDKASLGQVHKLATPAGGLFRVQLSDGTRVWLNASSSLEYPVAFPGRERRVKLSGEGYFEVTKNSKPFRVQLADSIMVDVLGTHFNILDYPGHNTREITLAEGAVNVTAKKFNARLNPGTQAIISRNGQGKVASADMEEVLGWKNGLFVFRDASLESIMEQVERWYDAKVVFKGKINQQFNATILRHEPLSKLLKLLELNGYVQFKIENKTVYVLPR